MVFQKHTSLCAAMFLAFVPTLSDANSACTKAAKNFNLCLDDKMDQKLLYLNKYPNVDETLLYYSGGILHNAPTLNKVNALTEQQDPSIQENTKNSNLISRAQPTTTENPKPVYDEICLLYTSDAADALDGVDLGGRQIKTFSLSLFQG